MVFTIMLIAGLSTGFPRVLADGCWTDKATYAYGDTITIFVSLSSPASNSLSYSLYIDMPDGTRVTEQLGNNIPPGTLSVSETAGPPPGQRLVTVTYTNYATDPVATGVVATCSYSVGRPAGRGRGSLDHWRLGYHVEG